MRMCSTEQAPVETKSDSVAIIATEVAGVTSLS